METAQINAILSFVTTWRRLRHICCRASFRSDLAFFSAAASERNAAPTSAPFRNPEFVYVSGIVRRVRLQDEGLVGNYAIRYRSTRDFLQSYTGNIRFYIGPLKCRSVLCTARRGSCNGSVRGDIGSRGVRPVSAWCRCAVWIINEKDSSRRWKSLKLCKWSLSWDRFLRQIYRRKSNITLKLKSAEALASMKHNNLCKICSYFSWILTTCSCVNYLFSLHLIQLNVTRLSLNFIRRGHCGR